MAGEAWPSRLRRATISKALKQGRGQGLAENESSMPRVSRTSAALALERGDLEVVEFGQVGEELAVGLEGVERDGHRRNAFRGRAQQAPETEEEKGGDLSVPALWDQRPKAAIWASAAFFSTWASERVS
jgi:hypothetical protein